MMNSMVITAPSGHLVKFKTVFSITGNASYFRIFENAYIKVHRFFCILIEPKVRSYFLIWMYLVPITNNLGDE